MSFVTVFTVGAMGFVLLVPILMVAVLMTTVSPLRRAVTADAENVADLDVTMPTPAVASVPEFSRAA